VVKGTNQWFKGIQDVVEGFKEMGFRRVGISHQTAHKSLGTAWKRLCEGAMKRHAIKKKEVMEGVRVGGGGAGADLGRRARAQVRRGGVR
jgi:hypothetical protein